MRKFKKCPKCGSNNNKSASVCTECNSKFNGDVHEKSNRKIIFTTIGLIIVLLLIFLPTTTQSISEEVKYEVVEEYTEEELMQPVAAVTETVIECGNYEARYNKSISDEDWVGNDKTLNCNITNKEDVPATFSYTIIADFAQNPDVDTAIYKEGPIDVTLDAGETKTFSKAFPLKLTSGADFWYDCIVFPEDVERCTEVESVVPEAAPTLRNVTKFRTVEKTRTDTTYKQVNWLFKIKLPWHKEWTKEGS